MCGTVYLKRVRVRLHLLQVSTRVYIVLMLYTLQDVSLMIYGGKDMTNNLIPVVLVTLRECRAPFLYKTQ